MSPSTFARQFERNCPSVRLREDEQEELRRLFDECSKWARGQGRRDLLDELKRMAK
jgi:predicted kinase